MVLQRTLLAHEAALGLAPAFLSPMGHGLFDSRHCKLGADEVLQWLQAWLEAAAVDSLLLLQAMFPVACHMPKMLLYGTPWQCRHLWCFSSALVLCASHQPKP